MPVQTGRRVVVLYGAIALAAAAGVQKSRAAPGQPNTSAAQAAATPEDKRLEVTLDGSAVRSRLVVRSVGKDNDARKVVILGRPTGVQDIPEFNPPSRVNMLPRELVRQAVLLAARDELGLATRDQVIDETPAEAPTGDGGAFEVASFIRDNRSYEITGTPHTERSKPEPCCMHSDWSHAARIARGASGTGRSPWRFSAGTAMRWPTLTLRRRSQKSKARRRHRPGSMSSTPSAVMTPRIWPACQALKKKLAAFLRMVTVAFPRQTSISLRAASDVVLLQPYCFRAHDAMSAFFGVATQHVTSMIGRQALEHFS